MFLVYICYIHMPGRHFVKTNGTRDSIRNALTPFYVQEYVYFKDEMFYKECMSDVITLKLNI